MMVEALGHVSQTTVGQGQQTENILPLVEDMSNTHQKGRVSIALFCNKRNTLIIYGTSLPCRVIRLLRGDFRCLNRCNGKLQMMNSAKRDRLALPMIKIAEMFSQALQAPSSEPRGVKSGLADGGKHLKPQSNIHTLLSADVRIEGNMTFTGGLRIDGIVVGDVFAIGDANNTIVVGKSGTLTGEIRSQHVILNGQVRGSVHCARSVEILKHGRVDGIS